MTGPRMLYVCATPGCEAAGQGFTDEPTHCSLCLHDLAGVYDMTDSLRTDDELRAAAAFDGDVPASAAASAPEDAS